MSENEELEAFRRDAIKERARMLNAQFETAQAKAEELLYGKNIPEDPDDPIENDPKVISAKVRLIRIRGCRGLGPPSLIAEGIRSAETNLEKVRNRAREKQGE